MLSGLGAFTALALALTIAAPAIAHPTERQNGLTIVNNCYQSGQVALTFDDGPYYYEGDVAAALNGGKGTFFLNGLNWICAYDRYQQIRDLHDQGHTLGSHTWSHKDLTKLNEAQINDELARVEDMFIKILGLKPLYFRPPYGAYNQLVLNVLAYRGYKKMFLWSDDTGDANGQSVQYSENVLDGVRDAFPQPRLVLSHSVIQTTSSQVLPHSVGQLQSKGYQLVAVDTCLGSSGEWPYQYIGEPGQPDDSWHC